MLRRVNDKGVALLLCLFIMLSYLSVITGLLGCLLSHLFVFSPFANPVY